MREWLKALGAGVLMAALATVSASAHEVRVQPQQQQQQRQSGDYLNAGMATHGALGYSRDRSIPDLHIALKVEDAYLWPITVRAGVNYRVYGACDNNCHDLDMEVYGGDGMLVDRDIGNDDTPYVQFTAAQTRQYYVRVWVYNCDQEPCGVAARVVSGGRLAERPPEDHDTDNDDDHDQDTADYEQVVRSELDRAAELQIRAGYVQVGRDIITPINSDGDGLRHTYQLTAGRHYVFVGACDQDCTDVDMEILDGRGRQVANDTAADDRPVVGVTPPADGQYTVRIWLASCSREPCYVGMRSMRRMPVVVVPRAPAAPAAPPALPQRPRRQ